MRETRISLLVRLAAMLLASSALVSAQSYSVIDLKSLPDQYRTVASGLNESSQVVGVSGTNSTSYAFVWTPGKGLQNLGSGYAGAINKSGDIVGTDSQNHAFLLKHDGTTQDLGTLGGLYSSAYGINSDDWIVGNSSTADGTAVGPAFLWTPDGGMQNIGTGTGTDPFAIATGINDSDEVVGFKSSKGSNYDAFSWTQGGGMKDLGAGGAYAINAAGAIAGLLYTPSSQARLWNPDGSLTKLGDTRRHQQ